MQLYFMRHELAEDWETWKGEDFDRPLTRKGKERLARSAARLAALELRPDAIVSSPLLRAWSTAQVLSEHLDRACCLYRDERLAPGFGPQALRALLADHPDAGRLLLVGHEPDFSGTIAALTGARVVCKKGSLARVDLDPGVNRPQAGENGESLPLSGRLVWLLPPKVLAL